MPKRDPYYEGHIAFFAAGKGLDASQMQSMHSAIERFSEEQTIAEIAEAIELCGHPFSSEELAKAIYARLREAGVLTD